MKTAFPEKRILKLNVEEEKAQDMMNYRETLSDLKVFSLKKKGFMRFLWSALINFPYPMIHIVATTAREHDLEDEIMFTIVKDQTVINCFRKDYENEKGPIIDENIYEGESSPIDILVKKEAAFDFVYSMLSERIINIEYVSFADAFIVTLLID